MSNMGYCRFRNTLPDLRDCYDHMADILEADYDPDDPTDSVAKEVDAAKAIIRLAKRIVEDFGD